MPEPGSSERPDLPLAVVVGAGGLGMVITRRLGLSHRLLIADRDAAHVEAACTALRRDGYDARPAACDITDPADVARLAATAAAAGPVRALVHVAARSVAAGDFRTIVDVNLVGAARVAQAFREALTPGGCGLFISSSSAHMGDVAATLWPLLERPLAAAFVDDFAAALGDGATAANAYSLSKAALNRLCLRSAAAWGRRGLRIVSLSPGLIATPMGAEAYKHSQSKRAMFDAIPIGREGTMIEIANVAAFLVSDAASFISGTDILVDGGMIAALKHKSEAEPAG